MDIKQEILRRYFRENDSERKISRDLQINRKTVKHYLEEYLKAKEESQEKGRVEILQDYSCSNPHYDSRGRGKRKLTMEIETLIQGQIEENDRKKREGLGKQVKRKIDILEYILSQGYRIGYTTVCNYIRSQEVKSKEAFIRQAYQPGEECEFDWAETKLKIGGVQKRLYMAVFTSASNNYRHSNLYSRQDTLAFMESHNDFFSHIDGVYQEMVYDNMRVAIAEFVGRNEKHPTVALTNLSGWFQFRWRFCNVRRGNEKGHVERSVEYVRRKAFCHRDEFDSFEQARQHLTETVKRLNGLTSDQSGQSPALMLEKEKGYLWKYPGEMECYLTVSLKVDKYSTFSYGTNRYSVPDYLVGQMVDVKVYANRLKVYQGHVHLCTHERLYGMYHWKIELDHYLKTLSRKPGALHGSVALEQSPEGIREIYYRFFEPQPRGFIELLQYCQQGQIPHEKLEETVYQLERICPSDVSVDKVTALLGNQQEYTQRVALPGEQRDEIEKLSLKQLKEITLLSQGSIN